MRKNFLRSIAAAVQLSFATVALAGSPKANLPYVERMVEVVNFSAESYRRHKDPQQFFWAVDLEHVPADIRVPFALVLSHTQGSLPKVETKAGSGVLRVVGEKSQVTIKILDAAAGLYEVQGRPFTWDAQKSFEANVMELEKHLGATTSSLEGIWSEGLALIGEWLVPSVNAGDAVRNVQPGPGYGMRTNPNNIPPYGDAPGEGGGLFSKWFKKKDKAPADAAHPPADAQTEAKKRCDRFYCKKGFWFGVGIVAVIAGIAIALSSKGGGGGGGGPSLPTLPKPEPWVDAPGGVTSPASAPAPMMPEAGSHGG